MLAAGSVLDPVYTSLGWILAAIYGVIPNYAAAIVGLTVIVLAVLTPLQLKGMRSQLAMQKLAPEVKRLQTEFKDDRMALNEAVMALYKENNANPVSGCLPIIIQSPVFIALFRLLQSMSRVKYYTASAGTPFSQWTEVKGPGEGVVKVGIPKHVPKDSELYKNLFGATKDTPSALLQGSGLPRLGHNAGELKVFGFDLARSASQVVSEGFTKFLPYLALIAAMIGLQ
ncbi:MAG: membrane protein insertase YidC, partial [Acidimicrobiales bacterium]